ncbi:DUF7742 family protein [Puniceibacterium confluentis]|uniref:DUF7742 family protein n=1 Tax=Puniceibacterium confluentis TaxID=1958944 RepID=UPI001FEA3033|nr:hypothetical protein [Puniceibacterium confluentis]
MLLSDLNFAARALLSVPPEARHAAASRLLARADAADRYRRRFRRAHPDWGNGTLVSLTSSAPLPIQPDLRDADYAACLIAVLRALARSAVDPGSRDRSAQGKSVP